MWDRKKKKYVSTQKETDKKIKTESGNWIKSSFKTGKYADYKNKQKIGFEVDEGDDGENFGFEGKKALSSNEQNRNEVLLFCIFQPL